MTAADLTPEPSSAALDPAQNDERHRAYRQRLQDALGVHKGYEYARTQNPTRAAVEGNLAAIEGGAPIQVTKNGGFVGAESSGRNLHGSCNRQRNTK